VIQLCVVVRYMHDCEVVWFWVFRAHVLYWSLCMCKWSRTLFELMGLSAPRQARSKRREPDDIIAVHFCRSFAVVKGEHVDQQNAASAQHSNCSSQYVTPGNLGILEGESLRRTRASQANVG
jgi:hypothetical protein